MAKNAIVGQSGGPTSVINASLAGVYESCKRRGAGKVYGMLHGVAGLLERRTCVLDDKLKTALDIELLKRTPSSYLGSCRYKLPDWHTAEGEAVYVQLFEILKELDIGYFFYIGGNDSMDTIGKLADYGAHIGSDIRFMGVPKTIDNDLMVTDHTPGYGSAAKYIGVVMKEIIRDATVYGTKYVTIVEIMGRNAGWLTAAAALAKAEDCEGVDMICLPEVPFNVDYFVEKVERMQREKPSIVIAVSEGVKLEDGRYVCELADDVHAVDAFGHKALTGTARFLANTVARRLDTKTRCIELSTLQRCAGHLTSRTDITEAYQVGGAAAKAAFEGHTGEMVALDRISNAPYQCGTSLHPISEVANLEKKVPLEWVNADHTAMTDEFLAYALPLVQAELTPIYVEGLPHHIYLPEAYVTFFVKKVTKEAQYNNAAATGNHFRYCGVFLKPPLSKGGGRASRGRRDSCCLTEAAPSPPAPLCQSQCIRLQNFSSHHCLQTVAPADRTFAKTPCGPHRIHVRHPQNAANRPVPPPDLPPHSRNQQHTCRQLSAAESGWDTPGESRTKGDVLPSSYLCEAFWQWESALCCACRS